MQRETDQASKSCSPCRSEHAVKEGVLFVPNVTRVYDTRVHVIAVMPVKYATCFCAGLHETRKGSAAFCTN
jgi:hypothetical protein